MSLPPLLAVADIHARLQVIFPEGTPHRAACIWEIAAKTIFVMLYAGAVEGEDVWIRPDQVRRMTDAQAQQAEDTARAAWVKESLAPSRSESADYWYAVNTRESIRDDTVRMALTPNNAIIEREGLPTTSPAPRYALRRSFADLLSPSLSGQPLDDAIIKWQQSHLSASARARITLLKKGVGGGDQVLVKFPNGETRLMSPGPSSVISKAVIEEFAPRFLQKPGLIWLSESASKVIARDDDLAKAINLVISPDRHLPDIILVDLGRTEPQLVFVEVVATDGPINAMRKSALTAIAAGAEFPPERCSFVTAFADRSDGAFKKAVDSLAWGAYAWFMSEPEQLLEFIDGPRVIG